jgi:hypothetical protein
MHKTVLVLAAFMILFGSIVASQAEEKQNPGGPEGSGAPGQPTTTAPKKPTTIEPTQPILPVKKSDVCTPPPPTPSAKCPPSASSCLNSSVTTCCTAPAGNEVCAKPVIVTTSNPASCYAGYFGSNCAPCPGGAAAPCSNHGSCSQGIVGTGVCTCLAGYTGAACQTQSTP